MFNSFLMKMMEKRLKSMSKDEVKGMFDKLPEDQLAGFLSSQPPQAVAMILEFMDNPKRAAKVKAGLPADLAKEVDKIKLDPSQKQAISGLFKQ
ncbi:MAG: hypothetical protein FWF01_01950 [Alphaproteobacteria bacterium]|nr:hypothetical protein [Alphaproteobacteria bacterium]